MITWSLRSSGSPEIEAATEAPAERTPVEAVFMQEEMNRRELGMKPLFLGLWLVFFMTNGESPGSRGPTAPAAEK